MKSTLGDSQDFANLGAGAMDIENRQTGPHATPRTSPLETQPQKFLLII
jgi:hypothetical protein